MDLSSRGKQINIQGTWLPVTPSKPIPTRPCLNQATTTTMVGRSDWMDSMAGFPQNFNHGNTTTATSTANGCLNSTSFVDQRVELNSSWEEALLGKNRATTTYQDLHNWNNVPFQQLMNLVNSSVKQKEVRLPASRPYFPFALPENDYRQRESFNSGNMFAEQNYSQGLNQRNTGNPHYGLPVQYTSASMYDLNSAPMGIADVVSNGSISFERVIQTPDNGSGRMNSQLPDVFQSTSGRLPSLNEMVITEMQFEPMANGAALPQFAPLTPDKGMQQSQASELVCNVRDERIPEKSKCQEDVHQKESNNFELQSSQESCLDSVVNPLPAVLEKPVEKTTSRHLEKGDENGIDLNKTPSQKPPRRKKHRPKVVSEKPKKTPKQTPKSNVKPNSEREKRKYVRRKGVNTSETPETPSDDVAKDGNEANKRNVRPRACKRSLNFDMEGEAHGSQENEHQEKGKTPRTIYGGPEKGHQEQERSPEEGCQEQMKMPNSLYGECSRNKDSSGTTTLLFSNGLERMEGTSRANLALDLNCAAGQQIVDYINLPEITNQLPTRRELLRKNLDILVARDEPCNANNVERNSMLLHGISPQVSRNQNLNQVAENSREEVSMRTHLQSNEGMLFPEIYKKRRTTTLKLPSAESPSQGNTSQTSNGICIESLRNRYSARVDEICSPCLPSGELSRMQNIPRKPFSSEEAVNELMLSIRQTEMTTGKRSKGQTRVRDVATLSTVTQCNNQQSPLPRIAPASQDRGILQVYQRLQHGLPSLSAQKYSRKRSKRNTASSPNIDHITQQENQAATSGYDHFLTNRRGRKDVVQKLTVDDLVHRLDCLNLSGKSKPVSGEEQRALVPFSASEDRGMVSRNEQSALVPFKGDDQIVPFAGIFDPTKKRKPRGKVDIDPATESEWKLIMYNILPSEAEGAKGPEYWKQEREILSGRAHAFIAHMHLLQGDRTFTPWRGSVLDSVIGVFLTQNVSDHLSSSAFMAMVASFPPKIKDNDRTAREEELKMYVEEPEVENIIWHESVPPSEPVRSQDTGSSVIIHLEDKETGNISESFESNTGGYCSSGVSDKEVGTCEEPPESRADKRTRDVCVSPQSSAGITSCSDSISEEEDPNRLKPFDFNDSTTKFMDLLRAKTFIQDYYNSGNEFLPLDLNFGLCHNQSEPSTGLEHAESSSKSHQMEAPITQSNNCCSQGCSETGLQTSSSQAAFVGAQNSFLNNSFINSEQEASPDKQPVGQEYVQPGITRTSGLERIRSTESEVLIALSQNRETSILQAGSNSPNFSGETLDVVESTTLCEKKSSTETTDAESRRKTQAHASSSSHGRAPKLLKPVAKLAKEKGKTFDWDTLRKEAYEKCGKREQNDDTMDSLDWEAVRNSDVDTIAHAIKERGMNNMLAERIKAFLDRLVKDHGSLDLEWLRDVPPEKAKEYLLSVRGLGLKSVECVRLLTLHHVAFPVDTNVGRIAVRLGWVPLQPLPESLQLDLLELYPVQETIQKYLWPRLCTLDQRTLYELHYQMITFGKVFCTKSKPNCNACPMRADCRHFASAFAREKLLLTGPSEKGIVTTTVPSMNSQGQTQTPGVGITTMSLPAPEANQLSTMSLPPPKAHQSSETRPPVNIKEPIIEVPASPEPDYHEMLESDIEDAFLEEDPEEIPTIKLSVENFQQNLHNYMQENNLELQDIIGGSQALVALNPNAASIPAPKLKNVNRLRTEHQVYELEDTHPLLAGVEKRFPGDVSPYLLAIWTPGETADTIEAPERCCNSQTSTALCSEPTCFSCNTIRESNSETVRGTLLIPCKTAMRGSFPLNGTYFQVNEVFADHESSLNPIDVPRKWLWRLRKRTVYFGTSIPSIFKGQTTEQIQSCFWRGFVCVRGFDRKTRAPRPLKARLHFPASRLAAKTKGRRGDEE